MSELGDLRLDKTDDPSLAGSHGHRLQILIILVAAIAIVVAGYLVLRRPAPGGTTAASPQVRPTKETVLAREQGENIPLPPIDETDPLVRDLVGRLSSHPTIAAWLATRGLIRNLTVVMVNVADGHTPVKHLHALAPGARFEASADAGAATILPKSYARYDAYADAVASLDARGTARLYATLKPRIEEAYRDLGYPTGDADDLVKRAMVELLKTPIVEGPVGVQRSPVSYTYVDSRLESLSAAQKQLLRMGPRNVRIVQDKLREIAPAMGIDPAALPTPVTIRAKP